MCQRPLGWVGVGSGVLRALGISLVVAAHQVASASAQTHITIDGTLPGSAAGNVAGPGGVYTVPHGAGLLVDGRNLFHSFGQFSLATGDTVDFTGPGTVRNIISRVTGGDLSKIDGEIKSSIDGANLFLMNSAGIVFGPDSSLNLTGSFHATTADRIDFADGSRFTAAPGPTDSQLTVDDPAAFGFLGASAAKIEVEGAALAVPDGKVLSFVAGELDIHGDGSRGAPSSGRRRAPSTCSPGVARAKSR